MRVIAGSLKGRRLATPRGARVRPTSDKLRERLFAILGERVTDANVLDGFAGTGAIGIEALSRGAARVTFVERDARTVALIGENLRRCGLTGGYAIIRAEVGRCLPGGPFDIIVLDPPYDLPDLEGALAAVSALLAAGGVVVLEHARRRPVPGGVGGLTRRRTVPSGDSQLSFYGVAAPGGCSADGYE